jgi:hypothetical protein
MAYWRSVNFWLLLIVGWLIASTFFSLFAQCFSSFDDMTRAELWITGITVHVLAVLAGFSFARAHTRRDDPPGFPIIPQSDNEPAQVDAAGVPASRAGCPCHNHRPTSSTPPDTAG